MLIIRKKNYNIFLNKKYKLIVIILIIFFTNNLYASKIDSLKKTIKSQIHDTLKIDALNNLAWEYTKKNPDMALKYCFQGIKLSYTINYKKGIASFMNSIGVIYYNKAKNETALKILLFTLNFNKQINNQTGVSTVLSNIGNIYSSCSDYTKALQYYEESLKIRNEYGDKQGLATNYANIGIIYGQIGNNSKAMDNLINALTLFEELKYLPGIAYNYNNIATIYYSQGDMQQAAFFYNKALEIHLKEGNKFDIVTILTNLSYIYIKQNNMDYALRYSLKALKMSEEIENNKMTARSLQSLGVIYSMKNQYQKAINYLQRSLKMMKFYKDKNGESVVLLSLSNLYLKNNNYLEAINYASSSLETAEEIGTLQNIKDASKLLSDSYYMLGDFENAYKYHKYFKEINDSIYNIEVSEKIEEISAKYKDEQQKKEIDLLSVKSKNQELTIKENLSKKRLQTAVFAAVILLLATGFVIIYQRNLNRQKLAIAKTLAEQEKNRFREVVNAQEKERKHIAGDLHDGVGMLLATAKLNLSFLDETENRAEGTEILKNVKELIAQSYNEVRGISHNLMPGVLVELGLIPALKDLCSKISVSEKLSVNLDISDINIAFSETFKIAVYRIMQEILSNIIKHSKTEKIDIEINTSDNFLKVNIFDNGIGFNTNEIEKSKGIGWKNIYSRIAMLNGKISVESEIGKGTTIEMFFPIDEVLKNSFLNI